MSTFLPLAAIPALFLAATPAPAQNRLPIADQTEGFLNETEQMRAMQIETRYVGELSRLRSDILARQAAGNGTLSPASRAAFQDKLDRIDVERRRLVRNNDSSSIDSMGRPIRTALD
jgi:hypothetical protein